MIRAVTEPEEEKWVAPSSDLLPVAPPQRSEFRALRALNSFSGLRPIRARILSALQSDLSAAATTHTTNLSVAFNSSTFPEIADFMLIYDECRVLKVKVHYRPFVSTASTAGSVVATGAVAIMFDPSVLNPTQISQILEETYSVGPFLVTPFVNGNSSQSSMGVLPFLTISANTPGPLAPITSSDCPGSAWFTLDGSTAPVIFQWYALITSLGTLGVTSLPAMYELDCEFRMRT